MGPEITIDFALVLGAAFCAGLVDAMVGGGGLIQLPALFAAYPNTSPPMLLGASKFAGIFGTTSAAVRYAFHVAIPWRALAPLGVLILVSALLGARTAVLVSPALFRPLVPLMLLAVLLYLVFRKDLGAQHRPRAFARVHHAMAAALISAIGFYDGFFGPGTGSFLMFVFVRLYGFDFLNASAAARVLNVAANGAALAYFATHGHVFWEAAVGMAVFNVAGALVGARLAVRGGSRFVRQAFIIIVSLLILRTGWTAFGA